ncbi:MAG TPA: signal peptidase II [Rhodocyclaceae bacterium]|jgi:signal peptidase II|nr:signal peptidase II [Rhodocyclaceae bacterium]
MNPRLAGWLTLSALVVALDQASKWIVLATMSLGEAIRVTDFFQLVLLFNPGAAFSFLAHQPGWQRWFFIVLAILICGWLVHMLRQHAHERALPLSFSLIIGGAIGNVIDRLVHGAVVDFLYFHIGRYGWPAFNVADSAISLGVALMLWCHFRPAPKNSTPENPS